MSIKRITFVVLEKTENGHKKAFEVNALDKNEAVFYAKMNISVTEKNIKQFAVMEKSKYNEIIKG